MEHGFDFFKPISGKLTVETLHRKHLMPIFFNSVFFLERMDLFLVMVVLLVRKHMSHLVIFRNSSSFQLFIEFTLTRAESGDFCWLVSFKRFCKFFYLQELFGNFFQGTGCRSSSNFECFSPRQFYQVLYFEALLNFPLCVD